MMPDDDTEEAQAARDEAFDKTRQSVKGFAKRPGYREEPEMLKTARRYARDDSRKDMRRIRNGTALTADHLAEIRATTRKRLAPIYDKSYNKEDQSDD